MKTFLQKSWTIILVFFGLLLIIIVMVVIGRYRYGTSFFQNFASNGLSTFLGVLIGVPVALWISNYQQKSTELEKKVKVLTAIRHELLKSGSFIQNLAKKNDMSDYVKSLGVAKSSIQTEMWDALKEGGELSWISDVNLLAELSRMYYMLKCISVLGEKSFNEYSFEEFFPSAKSEPIFNSYMGYIRSANEKMEDTMKMIDVVLKDPRKDVQISSPWDRL